MTGEANHQQSSLSGVLFKPAVVLAASIIAAGLFVLVMLPLPRFAGERKWYLLTYHAPIAAVFVSYLFDRIEHYRRIFRWQWVIEILVILVSLIRAVFTIPYVSGHALFLSYLLITTSFRPAWWLALVVFLEVVYVKLFLLRDPTLIGGVVSGVLSGIIVCRGKWLFGPRA